MNNYIFKTTTTMKEYNNKNRLDMLSLENLILKIEITIDGVPNILIYG